MFRIEMLPAEHGDAIWIEYGQPSRPRRIVIDGGPASSYDEALHRRIMQLDGERRIDLLVITHIDADHIDGSIILLREAAKLGVRIDEVWFNAWEHLGAEPTDTLGPLQGEFLTALLGRAGFDRKWNAKFDGRAIVVPNEGTLPSYDLPAKAHLTLLSPGTQQIRRLRGRWSSALRDFSPGDTAAALRRLEARRDYRPPALPPVFRGRSFGDDRSVANGSSISFVLEHGGASCLFAGDAHARVLAASLKRFARERSPGRGGPVRLDAVKLPHHGSLSNVSDEFLDAVECPRWLISTNGAKFGHPDPETVSLITRRSSKAPEFLCNYKSATTAGLGDSASQPRWHVHYPGEGAQKGAAGGIVIELGKRNIRSKRTRAESRARSSSLRGGQ